ncbi:MFS transporter [Halostreptopolyspora alba]|uniref:MFS transporter n=1 Tax=Halostreptopolyspora alba TaxID=2487137 RepID=A0A3N0ECU4_9ACTN|nr:MFS transporter [Nocardiopsaceae bacterium YIM 96095]
MADPVPADSEDPVSRPRAGWREWLGLAVLTLPVLVLATDLTVLFLAMPSIAADLRPGTSQMLWTLHVYGFLVGGFLITMGRLSDRVGRRRVLLTGAAVFTVLAVVAAYSTSAEMLIVVRALLGVAGATLMPTAFSLLRTMFHDDGQRRVAVSVQMGAFITGGAIGPVMGGALLEFFWWGSAFLVNVPALVLLLAVGPLLLPEYRAPGAGRLDPVSVGLSLVAMLGLVYGLQEIAAQGFRVPYLVVTMGAMVLAVVFVRRQLRLPDPLLDLGLFANRGFSASLGVILLMILALGGSFYLLTQYLQWVVGLSPLHAGLWTVPFALANLVGAVVAPGLVRWVRHALAMSAGLAVGSAGLAFAATAGASSGPAVLMAGLCAAAVGQGVAVTLGSDLIIASAPMRRVGSAAAMQEVSGELGQAFGTAFVGGLGMAVYRWTMADTVSSGVPDSAAEASRESIVGALAAADRVPGAVGADLLDAAREAFTQGLVVAFGVSSAVFAVAAVVAVVFLRRATAAAADEDADAGASRVT